VGAERDAGCTQADDMLPAERGRKENSHRVARRIVVARDRRQTERGNQGYAIIFFRADDVKPCGILYSLYTNRQI
jgi:hypothetical protein